MPLKQMDIETAQLDIERSISYLRNEVGVDGHFSISYPYGGPDAVDESIGELCTHYELAYGLTMFRGLNEGQDFYNPFLLKRVDTNDAPGGKLKSEAYCI